VRLKGCRRCGGDLIKDSSDRAGLTMACLQCGLEVRLRSVGRPFTISQAFRDEAASTPPVRAA
jgi:hypothetical protein